MEQHTPAADAITIRSAVPLVSGEAETDSFAGELSYDTTDPYAVTLRVETPTGPVLWTFSRELLANGLWEPSGDGDVQVWPCLSTEAEAVVVIELHSPGGEAMLQTPSRRVHAFVEDTYRAVAAGSESSMISLDSLVQQLLAV